MHLRLWWATALALPATPGISGRGILRAAVFALLLTAAPSSPALAQERQPPPQSRQQGEQVDHVFDSSGVKIRYVTAGKGEAVVLIHGWMGDSSMWGTDGKGNTRLNSAEGFQAIALDCRGHGKSDKPHDPEKYGPELAADVVRLLDHLEIERAHLIGYSSGAFIAGKVAATHPERVLSVIYGGQAPVITGAVKPTDFSECEIFAKAVDEGGDLGSYVIAITPEGRPKPTREQAQAYAKFMFNGKDVKALAVAGSSFKELAVSADDLRKCQAPILFIHGGNESAHVKRRVAMVRELLGRGEVRIVDGGDHMTALAKPEFGTAIVEFLRASMQAASAPSAQLPAEGLRALEGEWLFVEDRTEGRTLERLGPPMASKFSMRVEEGAVVLNGHGSGHRDVRVALDGSKTEVAEPKTISRYHGAWKDGAFEYQVEFERLAGAPEGIGVIRRKFRMTPDGLLVSVVVDPPAGEESVGLYRHAEDIAMPAPAKAAIGDVAWLAGAWVGTRSSGSSIEERWSPPLGGAMLAVTRTVNTNGKMTAFEYLRIVERDGGLIYVAQPGGAKPTEFVLTELDSDAGARRAVFDNPRHDYPKRIVYELSAEGGLCATIGQLKGGTPRRFEFKREGN